MILVTGGAGFIGSHLCEALGKFRVLDNFSTGRRDNLPRGVEILEGDVTDPATCAKAVKGVELIYHLAAITSVPLSLEKPHEVYRVNVEGTVNVLAAAARAGVKRVVLTSSTAVYGDAPVPVAESSPPNPLSPYGVTKIAAELMLRAFTQSVGLETVALRLFNVYGPRQDPRSPYSGVISIFLDRVARGEPLEVFGDGQQTRDFIHVSDAVRALQLAAKSPPGATGASTGIYNIGTGRATTILDLASLAGHALGKTPKIRHRPSRDGDIRYSHADVTKASRDLKFEAAVRIEEGLSKLAAAR